FSFVWINIPLIATALFLLSGSLCGASVVDPVPTFDHRDLLTGEILKCPKCPPGTFMSAHCTATTRTQCQPCRDGHFTDLWNYLPRCLYCSNICTGNQEVETECSPTTNRICRCKEGFYLADDFCIRHTEIFFVSFVILYVYMYCINVRFSLLKLLFVYVVLNFRWCSVWASEVWWWKEEVQETDRSTERLRMKEKRTGEIELEMICSGFWWIDMNI
uniref:TNFR-Cys domain-containing protein n=1 Tax=Oreochromis aureus TaxID=47969 RepID=A0A668TPY2_OREAU